MSFCANCLLIMDENLPNSIVFSDCWVVCSLIFIKDECKMKRLDFFLNYCEVHRDGLGIFGLK